MKTHIATGEEFGTITAELVDGSKPLVLVGLGAVQLITTSEDDADQLIRAGELAKQLHRQARAHGEPYVSPYGASADEVARDAEPYPATMLQPVGTEMLGVNETEAEEPLAFEPDSDQQCDVKHHRGFVCTRHKAHLGDHAAIYSSGDLLARWARLPASPLAPPAPYTTGDLAGVPAEDDGVQA